MKQDKDIKSVNHLTQVLRRAEKGLPDSGKGFPHIWYRGQADAAWVLQPTVLRDWFVRKANALERTADGCSKLVGLEKTINRQFHRMAAFLIPQNASAADVYFLAQHHGMPTRLLDWTTSPVVALFAAVVTEPERDGALYVLHPQDLIPSAPHRDQPDWPTDVVAMDHPLLSKTVEYLLDEPGAEAFSHPFILPVAPDLRAGRMLQQSSCFTLHMPPHTTLGDPSPPRKPHWSVDCATKHVIPAAEKPKLLIDLRRMGINWATLFPDEDHIAQEIRTAWELLPPTRQEGSNGGNHC